MDPLINRIKKQEKFGWCLLAGGLISLALCLLGVIILLVFGTDGYNGSDFLYGMEKIAMFIFDNIIVWIGGLIFGAYFISVALGMFLGINIGPKF